MDKMKLSGIIPALVTPFKGGQPDLEALSAFAAEIADAGVTAVVALGTTGEAATMSDEEQEAVFKCVKNAIAGKIKIIAGVGTSDTAATIRRAKRFAALGADALLAVTPPYNRPQQEGLFLHFKKIADSADAPIILYNVPSRTGVNMLPETVARLADHKNVIALKEASGSVAQYTDAAILCGERMSLLSGDDNLFYPSLSIGFDGVISVAANVAPREMAKMYEAHKRGDAETARALNVKLWPLFKHLFVEINPVPVKYALSLTGKMTDEVRLPLAPLSESSKSVVKSALKNSLGI